MVEMARTHGMNIRIQAVGQGEIRVCVGGGITQQPLAPIIYLRGGDGGPVVVGGHYAAAFGTHHLVGPRLMTAELQPPGGKCG